MKRLLIINADDLGYDAAVDQGILECMKEGVVTSATFMVNMPQSQKVALQARGLALGLHFNLTRVAPVWKAFPKHLLVDGHLDERQAATLPPEVITQEAFAQLDLCADLLGAFPTHIDVHKHLHRHENVLGGLAEAAQQRRLPVRSISNAMRQFLVSRNVRTNDHFFGEAEPHEAYWTPTRVKQHLDSLPPHGVTEWMCHPGLAPISVKSAYNVQREIEKTTWLSPEVKTWLSTVPLGNFTALSLPGG